MTDEFTYETPSTDVHRIKTRLNHDTANDIYTTVVNVGFGVEGVAPTQVSQANPLPISTLVDTVVDSNNSTTTPLLADATFTGDGVEVLGYSNVAVQLFADEDSAVDGMRFEMSIDNVNWDEGHSFTLTASSARRFQFGLHAQYFRVVYTNGPTAQGAFRVQTILHKNQPITTIHRLSDNISDDNSATLVVASLTAMKPNGDHASIDATAGGNLKVSLEEANGSLENSPVPVSERSTTAFGEVLTGQLHSQFQGSFEYTVDNTDLNENVEVNGGTVTQASGMAVLTTSTTTASTALFASRRHARYRSGLGGVDRFTALFTSPVAATEQYIGLADEVGSSAAFKNGYMVGYDGTTFGLHRFQNDVKFTTAIANWDDPLDGTGPSGMTIDHTKLNIFFIQFEYLGAGAINVFVKSDTSRKLILAHHEDYTNQNTEPSTHNPNFHHTMWVNNKGTTSNLILKSSSYGYFVEGKTSFIELHQPENSSGKQTKATVTTEVAIFTIRNKATYVSKTNFIDILLMGTSGSIEATSANNLGEIRVVKNATLGGSPLYSNINTTNSVVEIDTSGTTVTGGTEIGSELLAGKNDKLNRDLINSKFIIAPGETVTFAGNSANSSTINARCSWRELF